MVEKIELVELTKWLKWLDGLDWYKRFMGLTIYFYIFVVEISILVEMIAELSWIGLVEMCEMAGFLSIWLSGLSGLDLFIRGLN